MSTITNRFAALLVIPTFLTGAALAQDAQPDSQSGGGERLAQERFQPRFPSEDRNRNRFQDRSQDSRNAPGQFDFYVLALSWSPSFCESSRERNGGRSRLQQCTGERPYSFVVHGLWPQHERGFPRDCQIPAPRLPRSIVNTMLDIMPSPRLVFNQWDRHGTCTGLNGQQYFDIVRKARETVRIPAQYQDISAYLAVTPGEVEKAFVEANPGLSPDAIAVTCDHRRLSEVRICMSKDLQFRDCAEVDRRSCRSEKVMMPPVRGG
ncbi:MAG: ribonuclease T [Pseudorhodoplanes sp.]|uniref:ribonuclease T2 family protein n=1 Tax=Pseudorhodoplanes sp. TaxID=1934341 RepID=UPI003D0CE2F1